MTQEKRNRESHIYNRKNYSDIGNIGLEQYTANSSNEGTNAEVKIENIKLDFTTVKKEQDGKDQNATAEADGQAEKKK